MDKIILKKTIPKPPFEGLYPYIVFLFLGYFIADLTIIELRSNMIPDFAPPSIRQNNSRQTPTSRGSLSSITSRNLFSADGQIPDTLASKQEKKQNGEKQEEDQTPVPSSLPLNLVGTLVHSNPAKSIANIEVKSKSTVIAVRPEMDIDKIATLVSVERGKAIIRNTNSGRLEYIEIKDLNKISFNAPKNQAPAKKQDVRAVGQNSFEVNRSDILKYTSDLSNVLQQAAMQPRRKANGEIDCFQFLSIQQNSIFTQLGFQKGDCLKAVGDEAIDSPNKAMEMYQKLKGSDSIKLKVERDGRDQIFDYNIRN